ncbi:MAG: HD domain-containing protein [Clostridia bacterium]|nr:HD domain-containing protein [Clostridia bacterium]
MPHKKISTFILNEDVSDVYIIKNAAVKTSVNGSSFLACQLTDNSGSIEAKFWNYSGPVGVSSADDGKPVFVRGRVGEFKGTLQFTLNSVRYAEPSDGYNNADLVPVAPIDVFEAGKKIRELVNSIGDADYRSICEVMLERQGKAFSLWPAAKSVHHSFVSGLMMHTYNMLKTADWLAGQYTDVIDRDLLIAGTLLHDFAKTQELACSQLGLVTDYTVKGQLIGHLVMGAKNIADAAEELGVPEEKTLLLEHMILSHHGEPEFGAAVVPMCAEAELLHLIDLIDSRMEIYAETFKNMEPGTFSDKIFALEKKIYKHK